MNKSYDVAIIGGGLAGLAAAVKLASKKLRVVLFEQSNRLGGRCYSYQDEKTGDVVDNGQHVLLGAYHNTLEYLELAGTRDCLRQEPALSLPLIHPVKGFAVFEVSSLPRPLHLTVGMLRFKLLSWSDRQKLLKIGKQLQLWDNSIQHELAGLTVDRWLRSAGQSDESLNCFWYPIAISVMNEMPSSASALLFARSLRTAFLSKKSDSAILIPTIGQTDLYISGILRRLQAGDVVIRVNSEVTSLATNGDRVVSVSLRTGEEIQADSILSAVPYYAVSGLLPAQIRKLEPFSRFNKITASPIISLHLWFEGEVTDLEYAGLINATLQWVFNRRRIMGENSGKGGYLSCVISGARDIVELPKEELVRLAVRDIKKYFPGNRHNALKHSVVIKEKRATFSPTNETEEFRPDVRTPLKNFYLAGDWTRTGFPATIEGAVRSGFTAAEVIAGE